MSNYEMSPFFSVSNMVYASFSTGECLRSGFDSVLEKNVTGHLDCLSTAHGVIGCISLDFQENVGIVMTTLEISIFKISKVLGKKDLGEIG